MSTIPPLRVVYRLLIFVTPLVFLYAPSAAAQIIERPERSIRGLLGGGRPPDPERTHHELTLDISSLGGYDDNAPVRESSGPEAVAPSELEPVASSEGEGAAFAPREPGYTAFLSVSPRYWVGKQQRSFELGGRAYVNSFSDLGRDPAYGGELHASLATTLGRRHQMSLSQRARSLPFYTVGGFAPVEGEIGGGEFPNSNPANGYSSRRSWTSESRASLTSRWTPRNTVTIGYSYDVHAFQDGVGDARGHRGSFDYMLGVGRRGGLRMAYMRGARAPRPITEDTASLGYQYERTYRGGRRLLLAFGAGATYVTTLEQFNQRISFAMPSGYGRTQVDIAGTWSIRGDYRRGVSVLEGLVIQPFVTDTTMIGVGGFMGSRAEFAFSGSYSRGLPSTGFSGEHDGYGATAQLRFMLTRSWSLVVSDNLYAYQVDGVVGLPAGFPEHVNRQAIRVGMTLQLPLYGAATGRPRAGGGR